MVARVFGTIKEAKLDPWTQPLRVPAPAGDFVLARKSDRVKAWNPALYDFTPGGIGRQMAKISSKILTKLFAKWRPFCEFENDFA
jgi:hypothetical protein